jgi:hypothetical protein
VNNFEDYSSKQERKDFVFEWMGEGQRQKNQADFHVSDLGKWVDGAFIKGKGRLKGW